MRQIEKHSKKYQIRVDNAGNHVPAATGKSSSKKVRQAIEKQQKKQQADEKAAQKSQNEAIKRHREMQSPEVRARMDHNLKETNKRHSNEKEFFLKRWFRPKDDIAKIEKKRAKETEERMAATRKKADKTNEQLGLTGAKPEKTRKVKPVNPKDVKHGGGGTYKKADASKSVNPANIKHGGGGTYKEPKTKKKLFNKN